MKIIMSKETVFYLTCKRKKKKSSIKSRLILQLSVDHS